MHRTLPARVGSSAATLVVAAAILFPVAWMAIAGFKGKTEVLRSPFQFFPDTWNPHNYVAMLHDQVFMRAMAVTLVASSRCSCR